MGWPSEKYTFDFSWGGGGRGEGGGGVSLAIRGGDVSTHSLNPDSLYFRSISIRQTPKFLHICLLSKRPLSMINQGIRGRLGIVSGVCCSVCQIFTLDFI